MTSFYAVYDIQDESHSYHLLNYNHIYELHKEAVVGMICKHVHDTFYEG